MKMPLWIALLLLFTLSSVSGFAEEQNSDMQDQIKFDYYGFLTQGAIKTRKNDYFGKSAGKNISYDFRELGIGADVSIWNRLSFSALALSRNAGETDDGNIRLDHAIVSWLQPVSHYGDLLIIAGRVKIPWGLYNETRDVASTRPSILLPQSVYYDNARKFLINSDGVFVNWLSRVKSTDWNYKVVAGYAKTPGINNIETEAYLLGANFPGELHSESAQQLSLWLDNSNTGTSIVLEVTATQSNYRQGVNDLLPGGSVDTSTLILGFRQPVGDFTITGEILRNKVSYKEFSPVISDSSVYPEGQYVQLNYNPLPLLETFIRYDMLYINKDDRSGLEQSVLTGRPAHDFFAKDTTLGARYHVTPQFNVSIEYHYIDGTGWLTLADNPDPQTHKRFWDMGLLQLTYTF